MSWIEIVLITIGMSLDTFAAVECQGALVAKLEKKRLSMAVTVIALWQTIALLIGSFLVTLLNQYTTEWRSLYRKDTCNSDPVWHGSSDVC